MGPRAMGCANEICEIPSITQMGSKDQVTPSQLVANIVKAKCIESEERLRLCFCKMLNSPIYSRDAHEDKIAT